jgi:hypothetical protein
MTTTPQERARHIAKRAYLQCEVEGCGLPVYQLSRFCRPHTRQADRTGSPTGRAVTRSELKPLWLAAYRFIERHRDHPGIASALRWVRELMTEASKLPPPKPRTQANSPDALLGVRARSLVLHWDGPEDCLATVFAVFALRRFDPRLFKSDRHFRVQLASRFLSLPRRVISEGKKGKVPMRLRVWLGNRIEQSLGVLAERVAEEIDRSQGHRKTVAVSERLDGINAPFSPPPAA